MKNTLRSLIGCTAAWAALHPALAQVAAPLLKSAYRPTTAAGMAPRPDVRLNGETMGQLRQSAGPRSGFAPLATLPMLPTAARPQPLPQIDRAADTGLPIFIEVPAEAPTGAQRAAQTPTATSLAFLQDMAGPLQVQRPSQEFRVLAVDPDDLGQTHVRLQQTWQGMPVYGGEVLVHLNAAGQAVRFTGRHFRSPVAVVSVVPTVAAAAAVARAEKALHAKTTFAALSPQMRQLLDYNGSVAELVVFHPSLTAAPALAWHITTRPSVISRWESFVEAGTGAVLQQYESSCTVNGPRTATATDLNGISRTFNTYEWNNQFYMLDGAQPMFNLGQSVMPSAPVGAILTLDARNTDASGSLSHVTTTNNVWSTTGQRAGVSAQYNASVAYNYYRTVHNRNSIDGAGSTAISIIHVTESNGSGLDNAFWNGRFMLYGDGNILCRPFAGSLDIAGHEMTHGVIENGGRGGLEYQGQSGAINEHMADVFGCSMDPADWSIGEDVVLPQYFPSGAARSFSDPHNGATSTASFAYQPRTMAEYVTGSSDNGGVHSNSGIPNWAYYKFATATSRAHGEQVWYRALTRYLTRTSQFIDLRIAVIQAASDLYGATSADVAAARTAFDQVGILGTTPTPTTRNLAVNPGQDYILSYDTSPTVPGTWYRSSTTGTGFLQLSNIQARCRASVNDRGTAAVYVDAQGRIRSLSLVSPYTETVIQNQPIWKSASLSKDGTKLAAVTAVADTSIYLFNTLNGTIARARLYNPTNTAGVRSTGVRFADALEWDYSGEYLIYDAFNSIPNASGGGIDYWDIGVMRVWNNAQNTWGDGTIEKLVPSLPAGFSIGNPVLAKVSPKVMAFDVLDANGGAAPFSVAAVNVETGVSGVVYTQNYFPGTPSYSKLDDKMLFTAKSAAGDTIVAVIGLQANKVLPNGTATVLIQQAKWGTWYTQGQRALGSRATAETLPSLAVYPNPAHDLLTVEWPGPGALAFTLFDVLGRAVYTAPATAGGRATLPLADLSPGTYVLRATDGTRTATRRVRKE